MSLTVNVTPGYSFSENEPVTYQKLNQLGTPNLQYVGTLSTNQISNSAVTTAKIADANVTTAKIADNAITLDKLTGATAGDIVYWDGDGNPQFLAKGTDTQVLTLASGLPSWANASGAGAIGDGTLSLDKLDTTGAPNWSVPLYQTGVGVTWVAKEDFSLAQFWHFDTSFVFFGLSGDPTGSAPNAYISRVTGMENSASGVEDVATGTSNDWSWMRRPAKMFGLDSDYTKTYDDFHGTGIDKYFHYYDFSIGDQALEDSRGDNLVTVDDTSALIFEMTYLLPFHGAALFQRSYNNSSYYRLLWSSSASAYNRFHAGGEQLKVDRLEMDTSGQGYFFRLIYWEVNPTELHFPRFNLHLVGHTYGKQVTGS